MMTFNITPMCSQIIFPLVYQLFNVKEKSNIYLYVPTRQIDGTNNFVLILIHMSQIFIPLNEKSKPSRGNFTSCGQQN